MLAEQAPATYSRLLVPTNFGPLAQQVVNTALALANRHGAELTILHVLPRLTKLLATDIDHVAAEMLVKIAEDCKTDALERLSTLVVADTIKQAMYQVVEGEPATAIVKTATRVGADLIIMGQYRRRFANFLRCSVTTQVIRQAPCPVLVVKE
jgi:nucleotide-binding universal stress UspA family protein